MMKKNRAPFRLPVLLIVLFGSVPLIGFAEGQPEGLIERIELSDPPVKVFLSDGSNYKDHRIITRTTAPANMDSRFASNRAAIGKAAREIVLKKGPVIIADLDIYGLGMESSDIAANRINVSEFKDPVAYVLVARQITKTQYFEPTLLFYGKGRDRNEDRWFTAEYVQEARPIPGLAISNFTVMSISGKPYYSFTVEAWPTDDLAIADGG